MGTASDWAKVLLFAGIWCGGLIGINALVRRAMRVRPLVIGAEVGAWLLTGVCFGIGVTFRGAAFRWPLVAIMVAFFVAAVVVLTRGKRTLTKIQ